MADKVSSREVSYLKERVEKNPALRFFIPLAEAYLECDMQEEAINVLVEGIRNHPASVSGHRMLGGIYFENDRMDEAKLEFEQVLALNPESIPALKKLAMIFQNKRQLNQSVEACIKILTIDPHDQEGKLLLSTLEGAVTLQAEQGISHPAGEVRDTAVSSPIPEISLGESPSLVEERPLDEIVLDQTEASVVEAEEVSTILASAYMEQGEYQEAAFVYRKLIARDSADEESKLGLETALRMEAARLSKEAVVLKTDLLKGKKVRYLERWLQNIREDREGLEGATQAH